MNVIYRQCCIVLYSVEKPKLQLHKRIGKVQENSTVKLLPTAM